jgi:flavin reductase (DIM6/NTAB) family NADH-FMN oxidoreductase RutF
MIANPPQACAHRETGSPADARALRDALGRFITGVAVVTAVDDVLGPLGVTVNSFNSVSLDPPLVLWSLARRAWSLPGFERSTAFAINILSEEQDRLAERFASPGADKWAGVAYRLSEDTGTPILTGVEAALECRRERLVDGGDHVIFLGRPVRLHYGVTTRPLAFYRGRYTRLVPSSHAPQNREVCNRS